MDLSKTTFEANLPKRVSYILATKNHADKLDEALKRMRTFKGREDELLIMDGGSTDHTKEVVKKHADIVDTFISEPDVQPAFCRIGFDGKPNKDPIHAVNKGIFLARGKYIKTISDDDIYHPEGMKQAIKVMEEHPEIDLLMCGGSRERNGRIEYVYLPRGVNYGRRVEDVFQYGRGCGVGHFFRRSALARAGLHPFYKFKPNGEFIVNADAEYVLKFFKSGATVRFCRINAFHSPYSHYDYPSLGFVKESSEKYWLRSARDNCSFGFYIRFHLSNIIKKNALFGKFVYIRKIIRKMIKNRKIKYFLGKKISRAEMVWDGGFS